MRRSMLFEAVAILLFIVLAFILYIMVTAGVPSAPEQWTSSNITISPDPGGSMFIGPGDVLYTVSGDSVSAIAPDGTVKWRAGIPDESASNGYIYTMGTYTWRGLQAAFDNDTVCLLVTPRVLSVPIFQELLVFSGDGNLLWSKPLYWDGLSDSAPYFNIDAGGGQIYLHSGSNETVYDRSGNALWQAENVYFAPGVDGNGTLYAMPGLYTMRAVEAYGPDGRLKWHYGLGNDSFLVDGTMNGWNEPLYSDHTIFVQQKNGLIALNEDGSLRWKKEFHDAQYIDMDLQGDGNWYVGHINFGENGTADNTSYLSVVRPDGSEIPLLKLHSPTYNMLVSNGIAYYYGRAKAANITGLNDLPSWRIEAYGLDTGRKLWSYTIQPARAISSTLNESSARGVMYGEMQESDPDSVLRTNRLTPNVWYKQHSLPYGYEEVRNSSSVWLTPWSGGVYVSYWAYNYEYPFFFDRSRCIYGGGLYALDRNGKLLWEAPTDSEISDIAVNNGTVYYSTRAGKLSASTGGAAAGFALTAALYLFLRFFLAGAVTRARSLVDKNGTRNSILKFIADNPGTSLFDISKELGVNMGTARYHLMILSINHRVVSYKADDKYVRYFTNAGSYSQEQQFIVSMMRREGIKKVLNALLEKPGLSNIGLARELGLTESAASRYMKELVEKGIVSRESTGEGRLSYYINSEYQEPVAFAVERLGNKYAFPPR